MKHMTVASAVLALVGIAPAVDSLNVRMIGYYLTGADRIAVEREYACILAFHGGLRLISVADPAHPYEVGQYRRYRLRLRRRPLSTRTTSILRTTLPGYVSSRLPTLRIRLRSGLSTHRSPSATSP